MDSRRGLSLGEELQARIHVVRGRRVMLDFDFFSLCEVETKSLNGAVRRNAPRFPPLAFTEQGVAMLSGILTGERAVRANVA
ncbi:MAG: ORF6N domain-containing protein, partial [Elusimicrobia bacterium]|nr:ORF6N domain-containing protein [Elusimicrobiota bacterium]